MTTVFGENMLNNPLSNYFRRPALYFSLPSKGMGYPEGSLNLPENGEIPIYPMTALDEITARTPDALFNGVAVVELIRSCAPNILDPWVIPQIDLDPLLLSIKIATKGSTAEVDTVCPKCGESHKYDVDLVGMLNSIQSGKYNELHPVNSDIAIKYKSVPYRTLNKISQEQFSLQQTFRRIQDTTDEKEKETKTSGLVKDMTELASKLTLEMIEYVKTPTDLVLDREFIKEYLLNIPKKEYEFIRDKSIALKQETEIKPLEIKCQSCTHEYQQPFDLNISDFFD